MTRREVSLEPVQHLAPSLTADIVAHGSEPIVEAGNEFADEAPLHEPRIGDFGRSHEIKHQLAQRLRCAMS